MERSKGNLPTSPLNNDMSFFAQTKIRLFSDEPIIDFIDSLNLPLTHKQLLKRACINPSVRQELDRIWECLEFWGEDCRKKAERLIDRIYWNIRNGS
jgi:hypothetical protein